jgi:hypothetical protein
MIRAQSDIALNAAQRCLSRKRPVLHVAKANNTSLGPLFVGKSCLTYYSKVSYAAETFAMLDEQVIYHRNYLIVALAVVQNQHG